VGTNGSPAKKRVLHLIETSGPGGAERVLINIVENLDRTRHESVICLLKEGWLAAQLRQRGFEPITIPQRKGHDPRWISQCVGLIRRKRIDVLHTHEFSMNTYGSVASWLTRVPMIATVHGKAYYGERWRRRMAYRLVARHAVQMVAVAEDIRRFLIDHVGATPGKLCTIYNGVDSKTVCTAADGERVRYELGISKATTVIGTIANLYPVKGHTFLLKAAAQVARVSPETVWLFAGRGSLLGQLQEEARQLGIVDKVRFLGFRNDAGALLQAMDLFVLPSLSEGLPVSILEAMAAGRPVVATNVGGNREVIVEGKTGFLVPPGDSGALASQMVALLADRQLAQRFGTEGHTRVRENFTLERMVSAYERLYERA
jgi:glycosyltransferase involved in cell wall biosynthesis